MDKIAFFVEGLTEVIFIKKLLLEITNREGLQIETSDAKRYISYATITAPNDDTSIYILIFNCGNDFEVKQKIKTNEERLKEEDFKCIIGLRDLYPLKNNELQPLKDELYTGLISCLPIKIVIAIREVEAWFIQEYTHFSRLNATLTPAKIEEELGFNPQYGDSSDLHHPAKFLHNAYQLVNLKYKKREYQIHMTTDAIDYNELYLTVKDKKTDLSEFIDAIENIF